MAVGFKSEHFIAEGVEGTGASGDGHGGEDDRGTKGLGEGRGLAEENAGTDGHEEAEAAEDPPHLYLVRGARSASLSRGTPRPPPGRGSVLGSPVAAVLEAAEVWSAAGAGAGVGCGVAGEARPGLRG